MNASCPPSSRSIVNHDPHANDPSIHVRAHSSESTCRATTPVSCQKHEAARFPSTLKGIGISRLSWSFTGWEGRPDLPGKIPTSFVYHYFCRLGWCSSFKVSRLLLSSRQSPKGSGLMQLKSFGVSRSKNMAPVHPLSNNRSAKQKFLI